VDIHSSRGQRGHGWTITARSHFLHEPVTIQWKRPPKGWRLWLVDAVGQARIDMNRQKSYTYTPCGTDERKLVIKARKLR
jgi:hypothetical protein